MKILRNCITCFVVALQLSFSLNLFISYSRCYNYLGTAFLIREEIG